MQMFQKHWEFLKKSAEHERLSHAYIFSGNDEKEKEKLALQLIQFLNCESKNESSDACQNCRTCQSIKRHAHVDVTFVNPAESSEITEKREITIGQIRELISFLSLGAWNSPYKCVVVYEAHTMNHEAQSAFLKLLEEPKGSTLFLLLTRHPDVFMDTIRSRAQELKFYTFSKQEITQEVIAEFQKLQKGTIQERFLYAKKLSDSPEAIIETLQAWLEYARIAMIDALRVKSQDMVRLHTTVKTIQETLFLVQTTNVNTRLALERIMLDL